MKSCDTFEEFQSRFKKVFNPKSQQLTFDSLWGDIAS